MDHYFKQVLWKNWSYFRQLLQMKGTRFHLCLYLTIKFKASIIFDLQVSDNWLTKVSKGTKNYRGKNRGITKTN